MERVKLADNTVIERINSLISATNFVIESFHYNNVRDCSITLKCNKCGNTIQLKGERLMPSKIHRLTCSICDNNNKIQHCFAIAKQFDKRSSFADTCPFEYGYLLRRKLLDEACKHMRIIGNKDKRLIYSYTFELAQSKYVYVGLTYDMEMRHRVHCQKGSVFKFCMQNQIPIPSYQIESELLTKQEAAIEEGKILERYISKGYIPINKKATGGLGGNTNYCEYSIDELKLIASKYAGRGEWRKSDYPSYYYAKTRNLIDDIMPSTRRIGAKTFYTVSKAKEIIHSYPSTMTINDFRKKEPSLYTIICRNNWTELLNHFQRQFVLCDFDLDAVKTKLYEYRTSSEFIKENPRMAYWLSRNKIRIIDIESQEQKNNRTKHMQSIKSKPVICYNLNGDFVKEYNNAREAEADGFNYKNISDCCTGKKKTHKQHIFRFKQS